MFSFANKPLELGALLEQSFKLYRQTFAKIWYLAAIIMGLAQAQRFTPAFINQPAADGQEQQALGLHLVSANFVFLLLLMFVSAFFVAAIIHRIYNLASNPHSTLQQTFAAARAKVFTVFAAMLLIAVLVGAGLLLFVIPGFIVAVLLIFYLPNILFNDDKVFDSITNSFKLVWGFVEFGRTVAVLLPAVLLMVIISPLLILIMGKSNILGQSLGEVIVATLIVPYFNSAILVQYNDLRLRHKLPGLNQLTVLTKDQSSLPK